MNESAPKEEGGLFNLTFSDEAGNSQFLADDTHKSDGHDDGKKVTNASVPSSVFNLANTIIGASTLAMPSVCASGGVLLFIALILLFAVLSHFSIKLLIRSVDIVSARGVKEISYNTLGREAYGKYGDWAVSASIIIQQFGACIAYILIISEVLVPVLTSNTDWNIPAKLIIVFAVIFPLCMLKSMDSLKFTSLLALFFIVSFIISVVAYSLSHLTPSTTPDPQSKNLDHPKMLDNDGGAVTLFAIGANFLAHASTAVFAFVCHFNVFPIYSELKQRDEKTMTRVSLLSIVICAAAYIVVGTFGYLAFLEGAAENGGDLLNNFNFVEGSFRILMDVVRVGLSFALIFSYPVLVFEMRHIMTTLVWGHQPYSLNRTVIMNLCILVPSTIVAIVAGKAVGTVFDIVGATTAIMIVFILPSMFYLKLATFNDPKQKIPARALLIFGAIVGPICFVSVCLKIAGVI